MESECNRLHRLPWQRLLTAAAVLLPVLLALAVLLAARRAGTDSRVYLSPGQDLPWGKEWQYLSPEGPLPAALPYKVRGQEASFRTVLPEILTDNTILAVPSYYQYLEILIDDDVIFYYGPEPGDAYFMPSKVKCTVPLSAQYAGRDITIRVTPRSNFTQMTLFPPVLTTRSEFAGSLIENSLISLISCTSIGTIGLLLLLLSATFYRDHSLYNGLSALYLGLFMLISVFWVITDSEISQLLFANSQFGIVLSFELFMLLPAPLLLFVDTICCCSKTVLRVLLGLCGFNFMLQNSLYLLKTANFIELVPLTHLVMIGSIITLIGLMGREWSENRSFYARWLLIGISLFAGISILSLIPYYMSSGTAQQTFFLMGFFVFMLILAFLCIRKVLEMARSSAKVKAYKELAYTDMLTGLANRTLYERRMKVWKENFSCAEHICVLMFDVNNLKTINDQFGHDAGDRIIRDAAACIRTAFGEHGECFRIGGDEFIAVLWNKNFSAEKCSRLLSTALKQCNLKREHKLSLSWGVSVRDARDRIYGSMQEMVKAADQNMYEEKHKYHSSEENQL